MSPPRPSAVQLRPDRRVAQKNLPPRIRADVRSDGSTILLVDDDPAVREGLRRVLATGGWRIICASSGDEALEYLQAHEPDLLITDLSMAAVSGWDLLFHENLQRPELPVFVITALPLSSVGGADRFAHEFFQKPLDLDALLAAVARYIGPPCPAQT